MGARLISSMASTPLAFILWWFGGLFGLHHLYLGRDLHAYLTWTVAPFSLLVVPWMVFWFRDFLRLSDYVEDANGGPDFMARLNLLQKQGMPRTSGSRLLAQMFFGSYFGSVARVGLAVWTWRLGVACARRVQHGPWHRSWSLGRWFSWPRADGVLESVCEQRVCGTGASGNKRRMQLLLSYLSRHYRRMELSQSPGWRKLRSTDWILQADDGGWSRSGNHHCPALCSNCQRSAGCHGTDGRRGYYSQGSVAQRAQIAGVFQVDPVDL